MLERAGTRTNTHTHTHTHIRPTDPLLYVVPSVPQRISVTAVECYPNVGVVVFPKHLFHAALITRGSTPGRNFCDVPCDKFFRVIKRGGADEYTASGDHLCEIK